MKVQIVPANSKFVCVEHMRGPTLRNICQTYDTDFDSSRLVELFSAHNPKNADWMMRKASIIEPVPECKEIWCEMEEVFNSIKAEKKLSNLSIIT